MKILPGLLLALGLAMAGHYLANLIGIDLLELPKSPISPIMMAILLGILIRNTISLPAVFEPGIRFSLVRVLRLGIVLLGIRLSLGEAGEIGLKSLPVIVVCVAVALVVVTWISTRLGLSRRLGTLIAAGTGICGATAIVALSPTINAKDDETAYAVACITLFGVIAMLAYPFLAHWMFDGEAFRIGLFLGTSVHETAQVAGAGLVYQEYYGQAEALDTATVTKLVRNLGMLVVIPLLSVVYHRNAEDGEARPSLWSMVPLFVIGFALMSLLRTVGDLGAAESGVAFGFLPAETWQAIVGYTKQAAELCLGIAMAAVGLGTSLAGLKEIGFKPLGVGLFSAVLVGAVSFGMISLLY
jgi:uncharacterized integral membrane protein (TIGR00698 family)